MQTERHDVRPRALRLSTSAPQYLSPFIILLLILLSPAEAAAIKIQIRGSAGVEAVTTPEGDGVIVRGELVDDVGAPIAASVVAIQVLADDKRALALPSPSPCDREGRSSVGQPAADEITARTDERGAFCARTTAPLPRGTLRVRYAGSKLYEAVEVRVAIDVDPARPARTLLRFEPPVDTVDLDRESFAVVASLRVDRNDTRRSATARREGLAIVLEDEQGKKLGEAATGGDGRARFEIRTAELAGPGAGELRLRFDPTGALAGATTTTPIVRRSTVTLKVDGSPSGDPADGIAIDVTVASARGPVADGVVEALRGVESVGAGDVSEGKARVVVAFASERAGVVPLTLRYVESAPWWRAGASLPIEVRVTGPGIFRQVLLGAVVLAIAAWVVSGWRRAPKRLGTEDPDSTRAPPSGRAGVSVLSTRAGASGWKGHVSDAHDGTPIVGAELRIVVPTFQGDGVVSRATTDENGAFALEGAHRHDARLVVDAPFHAAYEQALPQPSVLAIALVTRRRALLDRLVRWARRHGAPFDGPPEPTPGHVRRTAARSQQGEIEAWARRVEHAAFGPDEVDAERERIVRGSEPKASRGTDAAER